MIRTVQSIHEMNDVHMMREGGVIGHGGFCECFPSPAQYGVLSMSRGFTLRHTQTSRDSFFCLKAVPLSSGWIVPRVTIAKGNSINST